MLAIPTADPIAPEHRPLECGARLGLLLLAFLVVAGGCDLVTGPGNRPPRAEITTPSDGAEILEDETVTLLGRANDPEDGPIAGRALTWRSHLNGVLGSGDSVHVGGLAPGRHRIALVATDGAGATDTARVTLTVADQPEPIALPYRLEPTFEALSLRRPTNMVAHPEGGRLYVAEQRGLVRTFPSRASAASAERVLDVRDRIYLEEPHAEEGVLGLALDPNFSENGYLYLLYTAPGPDGGRSYTREPTRGVRTVLTRFEAAGPRSADPATGTVLLTVDQPGRYHNGGQLAFGPEGYLYVSIGDGGTGGEPAQETGNLLGSILRIDPRTSDGDRPYSVPPDNPFATGERPGRAEIYAWGFRNVWRFSVDPETGRLWAGDVGHTRYEELSLVERGRNYGWNEREGAHCLRPEDGCRTAGLDDPVHEYGHGWGASVLGGHVYRGDRLPELRGLHVYADFVSSRVWALSYSGANVEENRLIAQHERPRSAAGQIAEIAAAADGRLFFVSLDGSVYRLAKN